MKVNKKMENQNEKQIEQPHSVEFSMNAKGQLSAKVKCYGTSPEDAMEKALKQLSDVEALIKDKNGL